jgi:phytoene desaturase
MEKKNCAIIGSGLGGLAAAIRLAKQGLNVYVYEKNSLPGGKASQIIEKGFRFDTGPSLLTMPFVLEELFADAGEKLTNYIALKPLLINCKYYYPDGTILNAYNNKDKFIKEVISKTTEKADNLIKLFKSSKLIYDLTANMFLFNSLSEPGNLINKRSFKTLLRINKLDLFKTLHESNSKTLQDKKMVQFFDRYATYNGSNPYSAPATLKIIQHVENGMGAYICENGIYGIADALYKLALKCGVVFNFNKNVEMIFHDNGKVTGLKINSEKIDFDIVVSNADVNFTYLKLLGEKTYLTAKNYNRLEPSSSAIVFYWGVEGNYGNLEIHNILFSKDYQTEFNRIFGDKSIPDDPTVYIYISSKFKADDAPQANENWFVMINAPYNNGQNWDIEIEKARKSIINKISNILKIDISTKILFEKVMSPLDIENKTNSNKGSIYGMSSNSKYSAFLRHQNRSKKYRGLYFVGGSSHPGGGIPLVLLSAKIAVNLIAKYELHQK